jgi:predicted RecB family nuclease
LKNQLVTVRCFPLGCGSENPRKYSTYDFPTDFDAYMCLSITMTQRLSPSRLIDYMACPHKEALRKAGVARDADAPTIALIKDKGGEHENDVLQALESDSDLAVHIPTNGTLEDRVAATHEAMRDGATLIYQAALSGKRWMGYPDFLMRCKGPDGYYYEPHDAKLGRTLKPSYIIQLSIYADLLAENGWPRPKRGRILLGGKDPLEDTQAGWVDLGEFAHITARLKRQYEAFIDSGATGTTAQPCAGCGQCPYQSQCEAEWRAADAVHFVAGIAASQRQKLETKDISSLQGLVDTKLTAKDFGIGEEAFARIKRQAELQAKGRQTQALYVETKAYETGKGFALLPPSEDGDLYYDIEGDPLYEQTGLEYLHGVWGPFGGGQTRYTAFWAHDHDQEKASFEALMDGFAAHLKLYPQARIYHYAPYEKTALRRLSTRYATRESELDQMLRENRFVDLYAVVRQGIMASVESYSIKKIEAFYNISRDEAVTSGGDSIVEYERWRETGDQRILADLAAYNEKDVVSTEALRFWLDSLRPEGGDYAPIGQQQSDDEARAAERLAADEGRLALAASVRAAKNGDGPVKDLIAQLLWFHQRADKPSWWAFFDRMEMSEEDLLEDLDAIAGLTPVGPPRTEKRSFVQDFSWPAQDTKLKGNGETPVIIEQGVNAGTLIALDRTKRIATLKRGFVKGPWPNRFSLGAQKPIKNKDIRKSIETVAGMVASGDTKPIQAFLDFAHRKAPRLKGYAAGAPIISEGQDLVAGTIKAMGAMDHTCLFIQGPPGTGKTYTVSRAIAAMLKAGKRVAVSSNSHKAINNLIGRVEEAADDIAHTFHGVKKSSSDDGEDTYHGKYIVNSTSNAFGGAPDLVAGTVWHFCRYDSPEFDYLVIDEAGQVSIGNLAAMARCAKNIVLVGDQMQLPQPVQGTHPGDTGLSLLDYLLQGAPTVAPDFGILLNVSWRMHPDLCGFISDAIYDGRLVAHPDNARRQFVLTGGADPALAPSGLVFVPVAHQGNRQDSVEEAQRIAQIINSLLGQKWIDETGAARKLRLDDILIVAPYNLQVQLLIQHLPKGARVGTVDKFQGQEAPVAIVSMATSSPEEAPRGTDFLFSRQRLNVALSRAKSLSILVASPALLDYPAKTVEDLRLLDLFVWAAGDFGVDVATLALP